MTDDYPFHTGEVDGETAVGVLFVGGNGRFYEFQDPDDHDDYARFVDPRTGDVMVYKNVLDRSIKRCMGAHVLAKLPADRWAEFREEYVDAPEDKVEEWEAAWRGMPKFDETERVTAEG